MASGRIKWSELAVVLAVVGLAIGMFLLGVEWEHFML
jgi:hypothetical protein